MFAVPVVIFGNVAAPVTAFNVAFSGLSTDSLGAYAQVGGHASIGYVETPTSAIETVRWSSSASGSVYGTGANPTDFTAGDGAFLWVNVTISATTVSISAPIRRAPGSFAALVNQSFVSSSGNQTYVFAAATGTGLTWTYTLVAPPTGITIDSGTRTITFNTSVLPVQSGTVITVRATDQYGRIINQTFTLSITASTGINPILNSLVFNDPGNGVSDDLTANYTYAGGDTIRAFVAVRNGGSALTATQLRDGTGTFLERVVINPFSATTFNLTSLTATSNAGTAIDVAIGELNNGGLSAALTAAVSGLDFTAPTFASGSPADNATGVAVGTNIVLTFSENIFAGTGSFTLRNVTDSTDTETFNIATGVGSAGGTVSISGTTVTINPFADLASSKSYSIRWPAGILLDADGNSLAANTGDTLYNFATVGSAWSITEDFAAIGSDVALATGSPWTSRLAANGGSMRGDGSGRIWMRSTTGASFPFDYVSHSGSLNQNMEAEIDVIAGAGTQENTVGLMLRYQSGADTGYFVEYFVADNAASGRLRVYERTAGSNAQIGAQVDGVIARPFTLRAKALTNGSNVDIEVYVNDVLQMTRSDTSGVITGGGAGMMMYHEVANSLSDHQLLIDRFRARDA